MFLSRILLALNLLLLSPLSASWLERKAEGWSWHEKIQEEKEEKKAEQDPKDPEKLSYREKMQMIREGIEERLSKAILEPSPENVRAYIQEQKKWMDNSSHFANVWAKVLLSHPELDETTSNPVSQYGLQVSKQLKKEEKEALIGELAKTKGMIFYLKGKCNMCLSFSKVVKMMEKKYGWSLIAVSMDGYATPEYPNIVENNGLSEQIGLDRTPSLFVVDPKTEKITPVAFGAISVTQLENNIYLQFKESDSE